MNRVEFHNRADQARFLIILPDSPLGTGLILRKGEIENFSNLSNSTEFVEHGFDYSDDEEPGMLKKNWIKINFDNPQIVSMTGILAPVPNSAISSTMNLFHGMMLYNHAGTFHP